MPRLLLASTLVLLAATLVSAADQPAALFKDLQGIARSNTLASPAARAAWEKLVAGGPAHLPPLLEALNTPDTVLANWLRTAFDRIVDDALQKDSKALNADVLLAYVQDVRKQGRARRLALEVVEKLRPGTTERLTPGWLDDPEFRYEAVAALLQAGDQQAKDGQKDQAAATYRKAFAAVREVPQAQTLALRLKEQGVTVSLTEHLGFLADWYLIGPFDAKNRSGFKNSYPPEGKVDLSAKLAGKTGTVEWKRYRAKEATGGSPARAVLVNLTEVLGVTEDAVGYAYTVVEVEQAQEVELRGAADDNFTVWVNGTKAFGFEEYRNGVRLDRHRFRVQLKAGANTVLVKVCQAPGDPTNAEPNWEFLLRAVDATERGVALKSGLTK